MPYKRGCKICHYEMYRMYLRTKYLKSRILQLDSGYERGFETIGWFCDNCKRFELDKYEGQKQQNIIEEILVDRGHGVDIN